MRETVGKGETLLRGNTDRWKREKKYRFGEIKEKCPVFPFPFLCLFMG